MSNQLETNEFNSNRTYHLRGEVSDTSVHALVKNILKHNEDDDGKEYSKRKPIKLNIETYGGGVNEGLSLVSAILESETPVYTYCRGRAMSMGFILFAVGHKRFISRYATLMFHDVAGGYMGKLATVERGLEQGVALRNYLIEITLETTDIPRKKLEKHVELKEDWYLNSKKALKYGVADHLIEEHRDKNRKNKKNPKVKEYDEVAENKVNDKPTAKEKLEDDEDMIHVKKLDNKGE